MDDVAKLAESVLQGDLQRVLGGFFVELEDFVRAVILDRGPHCVLRLIKDRLSVLQERLNGAIDLKH